LPIYLIASVKKTLSKSALLYNQWCLCTLVNYPWKNARQGPPVVKKLRNGFASDHRDLIKKPPCSH
jgi:hypothetical protein